MTKSKNPVHAVFYLVLLFLHSSGLQVQSGLEYFVLLQQLVYVGALAIQFLFVVMLLDIPSTEIQAHQRGTYPIAGVQVLCIALRAVVAAWQPIPPLGETAGSIYSSQPGPLSNNSLFSSPFPQRGNERANEMYSFWQGTRKNTSPVSNLGIAQYGVHPDQLIIASLLLLVAMIGAVGLTLKRPVAAPDYDVFRQHYVDFQKGLVQINTK